MADAATSEYQGPKNEEQKMTALCAFLQHDKRPIWQILKKEETERFKPTGPVCRCR